MPSKKKKVVRPKKQRGSSTSRDSKPKLNAGLAAYNEARRKAKLIEGKKPQSQKTFSKVAPHRKKRKPQTRREVVETNVEYTKPSGSNYLF